MITSHRRLPLESSLVAGIVGWMYGSTMASTSLRWSDTPEYSHGWLVPAFALWFVWSDGGKRSLWPKAKLDWLGLGCFAVGLALIVAAPDWDRTLQIATVGSTLAGIGVGLLLPDAGPPLVRSWWTACGWLLVVVGSAAFIGGGYLYIDWLSAAAIIPVLWGLALIRWGKETRSSLCWSAAFLVFMIPLPYSIETAMREPLRGLATKLSTYLLQAVGFPCISEGYVIEIGDAQIGVTEACSGLSMLMVFAAVTMGCVMIVQKPVWYRVILCISWPAIAVASNVFRIVTTGGLLAFGFERLADITFHDLAGLAMMPVGLALLWVEMSYLDRLFVLDGNQPLGPSLFSVAGAPAPKPALDQRG